MKILLTISLILNILNIIWSLSFRKHQNEINKILQNNIKFSLDYSKGEYENGELKYLFRDKTKNK